MTKKFYLIIIAVLVVLNIFSWRIWWTCAPNIPTGISESIDKHHGRKDERGMKFLEDRLDLDENQKQGFEQLRQEYFAEIGSINENLKVLRKELLDHLTHEEEAMNEDSIFKLMAKHKVKYEKATFKHFSEMRQLCNEQQKEVFDTIFTHMISRSNRFNDHNPNRREYRGKDRKEESMSN